MAWYKPQAVQVNFRGDCNESLHHMPTPSKKGRLEMLLHAAVLPQADVKRRDMAV